jgi:lipopolysaccharide/colanic/teichoic acid biosynthesis glycosyltransferase
MGIGYVLYSRIQGAIWICGLLKYNSRHMIENDILFVFLGVISLISPLLTLAIERIVSFTSLERKRRYRLAFIIPPALALIGGLVLLAACLGGADRDFGVSSSIGVDVCARRTALIFFVCLSITILGAFLGGLIATALNEKLWEDNAPPDETICHEVLTIHQTVFATTLNGPWLKRAFDILLSTSGLVISAPVWIASAVLIWFEDPGPLLFVKNSVGIGGVNFRQYKYRSMVREAEQATGPVLAQEQDERVLWIGRLLRKTALDEIPQLVNILRGDMSFVGPRPQRTVLVHGYLQQMPEYAERHRVRPGLAGLAQVAGDYYLTPRQKLRFDRLYIRHISLGYDLKLIFAAFLLTFWYRWQKDWNGRMPRKLLHMGNHRH